MCGDRGGAIGVPDEIPLRRRREGGERVPISIVTPRFTCTFLKKKKTILRPAPGGEGVFFGLLRTNLDGRLPVYAHGEQNGCQDGDVVGRHGCWF